MNKVIPIILLFVLLCTVGCNDEMIYSTDKSDIIQSYLDVRYDSLTSENYFQRVDEMAAYYSDNLKNNDSIFFAGQISGVEGYVESIMSGLVCGLNMFNYLNSKPSIDFGLETMVGGICSYFETASKENFQPISANMGLLSNIAPKIKDKKEKGQIIAKIALENIETIIENNQILTY